MRIEELKAVLLRNFLLHCEFGKILVSLKNTSFLFLGMPTTFLFFFTSACFYEADLESPSHRLLLLLLFSPLFAKKNRAVAVSAFCGSKKNLNTGRGENFFLGGEKKAFERPNRKTGAAPTTL